MANYRGAIDRYITPNLGRANLHEIDAATLDTLYARLRATGGKCRHCWKRIRSIASGSSLSSDRPVSASAVREVHSVLSGAFKQVMVWGWTAHNRGRPAQRADRPQVARPRPRAGEVLILSGVVRVASQPLIDKDT